jgi:hypothetical protein
LCLQGTVLMRNRKHSERGCRVIETSAATWVTNRAVCCSSSLPVLSEVSAGFPELLQPDHLQIWHESSLQILIHYHSLISHDTV